MTAVLGLRPQAEICRLSNVTYVLPIKTVAGTDHDDLTQYLTMLSALLTIVVVDGSAPDVFTRNQTQWRPIAEHVRPRSKTPNGKVAGVCDGVAAARTPFVVVADDDVRYDETSLRAVIDLLRRHDAVVPQNYFCPMAWHTYWDSARTLLNRAFGSDFAGTTAVRRDAFIVTHGYCGAVLFENLELIRTLTANGFDVHRAPDVFVARRPPTFRQFADQRLRQAYDSMSQPGRLCVELGVLPMAAFGLLRARRLLVAAGVTSMAAAELGRRRHGGRRVFSPSVAAWAPLWVVERGVFSWLALGCFLRGGVRYAGARFRKAAHPTWKLAGSQCPEPCCRCRISLRTRQSDRTASW